MSFPRLRSLVSYFESMTVIDSPSAANSFHVRGYISVYISAQIEMFLVFADLQWSDGGHSMSHSGSTTTLHLTKLFDSVITMLWLSSSSSPSLLSQFV